MTQSTHPDIVQEALDALENAFGPEVLELFGPDPRTWVQGWKARAGQEAPDDPLFWRAKWLWTQASHNPREGMSTMRFSSSWKPIKSPEKPALALVLYGVLHAEARLRHWSLFHHMVTFHYSRERLHKSGHLVFECLEALGITDRALLEILSQAPPTWHQFDGEPQPHHDPNNPIKPWSRAAQEVAFNLLEKAHQRGQTAEVMDMARWFIHRSLEQKWHACWDKRFTQIFAILPPLERQQLLEDTGNTDLNNWLEVGTPKAAAWPLFHHRTSPAGLLSGTSEFLKALANARAVASPALTQVMVKHSAAHQPTWPALRVMRCIPDPAYQPILLDAIPNPKVDLAHEAARALAKLDVEDALEPLLLTLTTVASTGKKRSKPSATLLSATMLTLALWSARWPQRTQEALDALPKDLQQHKHLKTVTALGAQEPLLKPWLLMEEESAAALWRGLERSPQLKDGLNHLAQRMCQHSLPKPPDSLQHLGANLALAIVSLDRPLPELLIEQTGQTLHQDALPAAAVHRLGLAAVDSAHTHYKMVCEHQAGSDALHLRMLQDSRSTIRELAIKALSERIDNVFDPLAQLLQHKRSAVRVAAARCLTAKPDHKTAAALQSAVQAESSAKTRQTLQNCLAIVHQSDHPPESPFYLWGHGHCRLNDLLTEIRAINHSPEASIALWTRLCEVLDRTARMGHLLEALDTLRPDARWKAHLNKLHLPWDWSQDERFAPLWHPNSPLQPPESLRNQPANAASWITTSGLMDADCRKRYFKAVLPHAEGAARARKLKEEDAVEVLKAWLPRAWQWCHAHNTPMDAFYLRVTAGAAGNNAASATDLRVAHGFRVNVERASALYKHAHKDRHLIKSIDVHLPKTHPLHQSPPLKPFIHRGCLNLLKVLQSAQTTAP